MFPDDDLIEDEENEGFKEPTDEQLQAGEEHEIPIVGEIHDNETKNEFHEPIASPSVAGEGDVFSGDAPEGEPTDIDEELTKLGLDNDDDGPSPLSSDDIEE